MALTPDPAGAEARPAGLREQRRRDARASALARARRRVRAAGWGLALLAALALREGGALREAAAWDARIAAVHTDPEAAARAVREALAPVASAASAAASAASAPASGPASRPAWLDEDHPLEWRFAQAWALAAAGEHEAAQARYRSLVDDPRLGLDARYNIANSLMQQAFKLRESPAPGLAVPVLELAKEAYRQVLRRDPGHWPARYNYERAQRLLPDAELDDQEAAGPPENAERAATTMRGVSQGLP